MSLGKQKIKQIYLPNQVNITNKKSKTGVFSTYRFIPENSSFDNPLDEPSNECYCIAEDQPKCLPSGILDISGCQPGKVIAKDIN